MVKSSLLICCFIMACSGKRPDFKSSVSTNNADTSTEQLDAGTEATTHNDNPSGETDNATSTVNLTDPSGQNGHCTVDCDEDGTHSEDGTRTEADDESSSGEPPTSTPSSSTQERECSNACKDGETSCSNGELIVCEPTADRCFVWSDATDCESGFCADSETCLDEPTCNATNQDGCPCEGDDVRACRGEGSTCTDSVQTCEDGVWSECSIVPADEDTCELGNDANCNGERNEGCPCVDGETQDCGNPAIGICKMGTQTCQDKTWGGCMGEVKPTARDCSSSADNDCNGMPDNTIDAVCKCAPGATQACNEHPGKDGNPPCQAGSQSCELAADKASSKWGTCTGDVGPATADTCEPDNDANCNGMENEGCACINGVPVTCECGGTVTCVNGVLPSCAQLPVTRYRDADNDGFGNPNNENQVCASELGWVSNNTDCNDNDPNMYAGVATCSSALEREWCPETGGTLGSASCRDGCFDGECRSDGTIGVPGTVSCDGVTRCSATDGCHLNFGTCGDDGGNYTVHCDAHSDCPSGQKCWHFSFSGINETVCAASPPSTSYREVCDPLDYTCSSCTEQVGVTYRCPLGG